MLFILPREAGLRAWAGPARVARAGSGLSTVLLMLAVLASGCSC